MTAQIQQLEREKQRIPGWQRKGQTLLTTLPFFPTAMLLAMLIRWEVEGSPHYASMADNQRIAYISDIGAQGLKPLFITGSVITTVFLDLSFLAERYLRHTGRLAKNLHVAEKVLSAFASTFICLYSFFSPSLSRSMDC